MTRSHKRVSIVLWSDTSSVRGRMWYVAPPLTVISCCALETLTGEETASDWRCTMPEEAG